MLKAYGAVAGSDDPALARLYLKAVEGQPRSVVERLCEEIALGQVEGVSDEYPPKVPQFARLCRSRADLIRASLRNRQRELGQGRLLAVAPKPPQPGPSKSVRDMQTEAAAMQPAIVAEAKAREDRVASDLASRNFPPAPSAVGATDVQLPADVESREGVA
jgi:hypothetical protein